MFWLPRPRTSSPARYSSSSVLCGLTSANHDIESIFIDGLDQILHKEIDGVVFEFMDLVNDFSVKNSIEVFISASVYSQEIINGLEKYTKDF